IEKGNFGGAVVRRLRRGMDDQVGADFPHQTPQPLAIPDVERLVPIAVNIAHQSFARPTRVAIRTEEDRAMIAVNSYDAEFLPGVVSGDLRPDQTARTAD